MRLCSLWDNYQKVGSYQQIGDTTKWRYNYASFLYFKMKKAFS